MRKEFFEIVHIFENSCKPDVAAIELKKRFDIARKKECEKIDRCQYCKIR